MMKKVPLVFNETLTREMQMDSEGDQLYVKINEKEDKKEEFEGQKTEALYTYFELRGHTNLFASRQDEYIKMLEFNKSQFDTLLKWSKLIVGQRRRLLSQLITNQLKYYQDEIILARKHKLYQDLLFNIYLIKDDNSVLQNYMDKTSDQDVALGYYFDDLSVLHKYTQSDYKLRSEDEIAGIYPYSYEMLDKFRKYFSSIYSVAKDSASLDDESAMYKFSKVVDNYAELNIDQEQIGRENSEEDIGLNKEIVELFFKQFLIIEELNNSNLFNYPLVKNPSKFKRDLHLCRMYEYKSGLFRVITNRLPEFIPAILHNDQFQKKKSISIQN